jgi:hypothetical protein
MTFSGSKKNVARFVTDQLMSLNKDSPSTMIMIQVKSEGCFVNIATDISSDVIVLGRANYFSLMRIGS